MKKQFWVASAVVASVFLAGCQTAPVEQPSKVEEQVKEEILSISGTMAYRERIALPADAVITVRLEDVSLADAPAKVISEQEFTSDGDQVPLDFRLSYSNLDIKPNHRYSVRATIHVNGKLRFTTDSSYPVITDPNNTSDVNLRLVGVR
ncbi:YbaY family lipoprotein [Vibrio maerlii]|uniref:YbaY family lipoprotein n=1 Tax=Vibrio maerlii TaxID=2231648 RepID=UPI000E3CABD6|nr:YbaY family lipoprotein [Vibrio maerlii]